MLTIYHNPRCSKSRETLSLINEQGIDAEIIDYLNEVPTKEQLKELLIKLGLKASEIVRKGEPVFKEKFKGKILSEEEWVAAMVKYPKLIERPIVVKGDKAILGRPPKNVLQLLD